MYYYLSGNTIAHKSAIKAAGFRWNADAKRWETSSRELAVKTASKLYGVAWHTA